MKTVQKIAVLGSGGREHAIAWKLGRDTGSDNVFVLPGNAAIPNSHPVNISDFEAVRDFCRRHGIRRIFVGPEQPLADGIVDFFKGSDILVLGPDAHAARLESSKAFAKSFMKKYGVATGDFRQCDHVEDARQILAENPGPVVIKYDGLAAGKGVFVCSTKEEAGEALDRLAQKFGEDITLVLEELLSGDELSIIGFTDGKSIRLLQPSQDHKQLLEGDAGPNTGGMGAYCPVPGISPELMKKIQLDIVEPTLRGIKGEGMHYRGILYFGIMVTESGPKLLEYNVRLGDPETEVLLPALKSNLFDLTEACLTEKLDEVTLEFEDGYFVDVVMVSGGYPGAYAKGLPIHIKTHRKDNLIFYAGVASNEGQLVTSGGRVLNIVAHGETLEEAAARAYEQVKEIEFEDCFFRKDIGQRTNTHLRQKEIS